MALACVSNVSKVLHACSVAGPGVLDCIEIAGLVRDQVAKLEGSSIAVTKIAADIRDSGGTKAGEDGSKSEAEH